MTDWGQERAYAEARIYAALIDIGWTPPSSDSKRRNGMSRVPTEAQAKEMIDRISKGETTVDDAKLVGEWIRAVWERKKENLSVSTTPLTDLEDRNWEEHAERVNNRSDYSER